MISVITGQDVRKFHQSPFWEYPFGTKAFNVSFLDWVLSEIFQIRTNDVLATSSSGWCWRGGSAATAPSPLPILPNIHPPQSPPPSLPISERVHRSKNLFRLLPSLGQITSLIEANFLRIEEPLAKRIFRLDRFFGSGKSHSILIFFLLGLTFCKK